MCGGGAVSGKVMDCRQSGAAVGTTWWEIAVLTWIRDWDPCNLPCVVPCKDYIKAASTAIGSMMGEVCVERWLLQVQRVGGGSWDLMLPSRTGMLHTSLGSLVCSTLYGI